MRKLLCLSLVAALATPFAACGDDDKPSNSDTVQTDTFQPDSVGTDAVDTDTNVADNDTNVVDPDTNVVNPDTSETDTVIVACEDDNKAGTEASPVDLETVLASNPTFTICPGVRDVFEINATAGEILKITMVTVGANAETGTNPGEDDLDIYLYAGSLDDANIVGDGATADAIEQIIYTADTTGKYYLVVEDYEGSSADYNLIFGKAVACTTDADCSGTDICFVGVDEENFVLAQECKGYTAPSCGQGAEDATSSHSDSTAANFATVATNGAFTGSICGPDIDVFAFTLEAGDSLVGDITAANVGADGDLVVTLVGPGGALIELYEVVADAPTAEFAQYFVSEAGTYYLYLDYLTGGSQTADLSYTITADIAKPCKLDADCSNGQVCGKTLPFNGPLLVCADYQADPCGSDDDNSQAKATALTSGTAATGAVCHGGSDYYKVVLSGGKTDITIAATWAGDEDIDVYFFGADGTPYGASWYGAGTETITGKALPDGTYFIVVDLYAYATEDGTGTGNIDYSITATTSAASNCSTDAGCVVGGSYDDGQNADPMTELVCNTTSGMCEAPITAAPGSVAPGNACFDGAGASYYGMCGMGGFCAFNLCLTECSAQADCDSDWGGADKGYCLTDVFSINVCLPNCDSPTASTHIWGDADCVGLFGDGGCDTATNQCLIPE